jgi:hypothetical protein
LFAQRIPHHWRGDSQVEQIEPLDEQCRIVRWQRVCEWDGVPEFLADSSAKKLVRVPKHFLLRESLCHETPLTSVTAAMAGSLVKRQVLGKAKWVTDRLHRDVTWRFEISRKSFIQNGYELHSDVVVGVSVHNLDVHSVADIGIGLHDRHAHPAAYWHQGEGFWVGGNHEHAAAPGLSNTTEPSAMVIDSDGALSDLQALELSAIRDINHRSGCRSARASRAI